MDQRECPYCAETIKRKAKVCRFCSAAVTPIYVEHSGANKQIAKILDLYEQGKSSEEIASELNSNNEYRIGSNNPWVSQDVDEIVVDFTLPTNNNSAKLSESSTIEGQKSKGGWTKEETRSFNIKFFGGTILIIIIASKIFNNGSSVSASSSNAITPPFTKAHVCKAGFAAVNAVSPKLIRLDKVDGDVAHLTYIRQRDNTRWTGKCNISGNKIIWSFNGGRMRVHPSDSKVTFETTANIVTVYTKESNGSVDYDVFGFSEVSE
ncbi:hypothetical protein SAMN04487965_0413 [Microbulbifer donghaiensis]|uniref:Uncharacterized protein n=1 Tax=Microbulbifer donghaiensis TaxID=494016 RepID=A0A1M4VFI8_9GAMM|nr:hypothetical protein [Microbulbifer donghaiensis]SHE67721.1 hypothetical protein SAMN04487965_0413 [Microbulbifer donghaiensis]